MLFKDIDEVATRSEAEKIWHITGKNAASDEQRTMTKIIHKIFFILLFCVKVNRDFRGGEEFVLLILTQHWMEIIRNYLRWRKVFVSFVPFFLLQRHKPEILLFCSCVIHVSRPKWSYKIYSDSVVHKWRKLKVFWPRWAFNYVDFLFHKSMNGILDLFLTFSFQGSLAASVNEPTPSRGCAGKCDKNRDFMCQPRSQGKTWSGAKFQLECSRQTSLA